jgi:hypothetical protein
MSARAKTLSRAGRLSQPDAAVDIPKRAFLFGLEPAAVTAVQRRRLRALVEHVGAARGEATSGRRFEK